MGTAIGPTVYSKRQDQFSIDINNEPRQLESAVVPRLFDNTRGRSEPNSSICCSENSLEDKFIYPTGYQQRPAAARAAGVFDQQARNLARHLDALHVRPLPPGRPVRRHILSCPRKPPDRDLLRQAPHRQPKVVPILSCVCSITREVIATLVFICGMADPRRCLHVLRRRAHLPDGISRGVWEQVTRRAFVKKAMRSFGNPGQE